jgi:hypothetical protein
MRPPKINAEATLTALTLQCMRRDLCDPLININGEATAEATLTLQCIMRDLCDPLININVVATAEDTLPYSV